MATRPGKAPRKTSPVPKASTRARPIAPDLAKQALARLKKARHACDVRTALAPLEAAGLGAAAALWTLAVRGELPLAHVQVADMFADHPAPSPAALAAMWGRLDPASLGEHSTLWPGAPAFLFTIVDKAIRVDPAPWVAAVDTLPEPLRGVIWLELHRLKAAIAPPEVIAELRERILADPFAPSRSSVAESLQILGLDHEAIARGLLPKLPTAPRPDLFKVQLPLRHADLATLTRVLTAQAPGHGELDHIGAVLHARKDSVDELVQLARAVRTAFPRDTDTDRLVQRVVDVALERCRATGQVPPVALDELATFSWDDDTDASPALVVLPRERLQARIRRGLAGDEPSRHRYFPAVRYAFDEALLGEVLAVARAAALESPGRSDRQPVALGKIGPQAIPALERALAAARADTTFERDDHKRRWITRLRKAIAVALSVASDLGEEIDPRWDALLGPHPECLDRNLLDEVFQGGCLFGELLERLPAARARAIVAAWLAADPNDRLGIRGALACQLSDTLQHLLSPH